jgi:putative mRNA 3-end processing factor
MLLRSTDRGLYCEAGDFYVDPWRPVDRAVITHAHGDHARWGSRAYLAARASACCARGWGRRRIRTVEYGEAVDVNGVRVSLHPAGHILGSAQVRVEHRGEVWVVSGDYKTEPDPTCTPFEPVRCHTFVTESPSACRSTAGRRRRRCSPEINAWWRANAEAGRASILFGYALGKAQRLLAGLDPGGRPDLHARRGGAAERATTARAACAAAHALRGRRAPRGRLGRRADRRAAVRGRDAVDAPFRRASTAFASGWMRIRGARAAAAVDRGFVLSDHVDWPALLEAIEATGAERGLGDARLPRARRALAARAGRTRPAIASAGRASRSEGRRSSGRRGGTGGRSADGNLTGSGVRASPRSSRAGRDHRTRRRWRRWRATSPRRRAPETRRGPSTS